MDETTENPTSQEAQEAAPTETQVNPIADDTAPATEPPSASTDPAPTPEASSEAPESSNDDGSSNPAPDAGPEPIKSRIKIDTPEESVGVVDGSAPGLYTRGEDLQVGKDLSAGQAQELVDRGIGIYLT